MRCNVVFLLFDSIVESDRFDKQFLHFELFDEHLWQATLCNFTYIPEYHGIMRATRFKIQTRAHEERCQCRVECHINHDRYQSIAQNTEPSTERLLIKWCTKRIDDYSITNCNHIIRELRIYLNLYGKNKFPAFTCPSLR